MAFLPGRIETCLIHENNASAPQILSEAEAQFLHALRALPQLDVERALHVLRYDVRSYRTLLMIFVQQHSNDVQQIKQLLQNGNTIQAQEMAHRLKGVAGTLGADRIAEWADLIKTAVAEQSTGDWQQAVKPLCDAMSELIQRLQQLPDLPTLPKENAINPSELIQELKALLQENDARAHALAHQYPTVLQGYLQTNYEAFIRNVDAFEFSHALELLRQQVDA